MEICRRSTSEKSLITFQSQLKQGFYAMLKLLLKTTDDSEQISGECYNRK